MRLWKMAVLILGIALALWGYIAYSNLPPYDVTQLPLTGLLRRKADAFAANPDGLFRAKLATGRWARLPTPPEMPFGGTFARQPEDSSPVFYLASQPGFGTPAAGPYKYGLYLSEDDGATWTRVHDDCDFESVLLLPDGALFAVTSMFGRNNPSSAYRSTDRGKTWRDITGKAFGTILDAFPDPDHPGLVCLTTNGMRNYVCQAEDEKYDWKATREWEWHPRRRTTEAFFDRSYYTYSSLYMFPATLANYFDHDFGNRASLPAFDILPLAERFDFRRGEPVMIPIRVVFREDLESHRAEARRQSPNGNARPRPTSTVVTLVDQAKDADLWGIRVERAGVQVAKGPAHTGAISAPPDPVQESLLAKLKGPGGTRAVRLDARSPYDRTVDIGTLFDFSRAGEYRVQLSYHSGSVADAAKGQWGGGFDGPVFRVVIEE